MMKLFKILFFNSLIIGTLISISAYSWLSAWIGLEINLLSFIPLLKSNKNTFSSESSMKYFIAQMMGSSLLLFSICIFMFKVSAMKMVNSMELILMSSALLLKMGASPFHFWFPEVMSGLNWTNSFILLTWQKIAPMLLLSYQINNNIILFSIIIVLSSMISGIQGLNQICLQKIMAYSSINHISWMISSLLSSMSIFFYYFLIYSLINLNLILIFNKFKIKFINQLSNLIMFNKKIKFMFMMNFLSLGGLPPFLGFFPKWLTINSMIESNNYLLSFTLIIFTLITLYFYLRITFSSFTLFSYENINYNKNKIMYMYMFTNSISLLGIIMCSMIYSSM